MHFEFQNNGLHLFFANEEIQNARPDPLIGQPPLGDMEADAMEEFDNREDFEITFFTFVHRGGIEDGISFFYVIDFMRRKGVMDNILSEIGESQLIVIRDGDVGMNRESAMAPGAHFINEFFIDTLIIFEDGEYFFAEDEISLEEPISGRECCDLFQEKLMIFTEIPDELNKKCRLT
ncbi:MAG: hypothetical protein A2Y62_09440 [Candidatus Fischerbacteria bacterium RBG_13_37_8]|uniref:Uncharacterized protein n=1 Tax=Candidatus Fischerbacteria bacterium RBG_13_37_8 TaxID=1817863 RepID=A0A1F5VV46_9BACT|nr:MAG: hypothetical protein A2Y62_09440 [Candidatus Fischerbacteria bacterium RBG_13_37_8]